MDGLMEMGIQGDESTTGKSRGRVGIRTHGITKTGR